MSSIMSSQVVLATAMAAVSAGTVILIAFGHQKKLFSPLILPRSCISSDGKKKKKKRVQFAEDVVEPSGDSEKFRKRYRRITAINSSKLKKKDDDSENNRGMPQNRAALYNGIIRDRVVNRLAYSYSL